MTIKDVEKLTGMTAKSIRLYESKGLIQIERDENNSYRDFSEENVKQLKFIKIMRYLDFSIQEIKELIDADKEVIEDVMEKKIDEYSKTEGAIKEKKFLCESIAKNYNKGKLDELIEDNVEFIEFTESEEYADIKNQLQEIEYEPFATKIVWTLMYLGPILWLIVNFVEQKYEALKYNIPIALIGTVFLTLKWKDYFSKRKKNMKLQKKQNKGGWLLIPGIIITIAIAIFVAAFIDEISTIIYEPQDYLFYQKGSVSIWIVLGIECIVIFLLGDIIAKISKNNVWNTGLGRFVGKYRKWFIAVLIIALYVAITDTTYVTEDKIIYHSWRNPVGKTYLYSDVNEIKAGYKGNGIVKNKGDFYYKVCFADRWIDFSVTTPNEEIEIYTDTYVEIDEFDKALMRYKPKKISSHENEKYANLDKRCIEIFDRIIDRK